MRRSTVALALLALTLASCSRYGGLMGTVYRKALVDLRCSEEQTQVVKLNKNTYRAIGCSRQALYQCHRWDKNCANLNLVAQERAAREFSCPLPGVRVGLLSPYVMKVFACGQEAIYHCDMRNGVASCTREGAPSPPAG